MTNRLLVFGRFAHDPQSVLTAVCQFALVGIELRLNISIWRRKARFELGIASLTYANGWERTVYDPESAFLHDCSLAHLEERA